jgi:uncharacterized protein YcfJ
MKTSIRILTIISIFITLSGCATGLGRQYGNIGGLTGAAIGGAAGGWSGAIIGGAAGAAAGGLIGDQQSRQWYDDQLNAYPQGRSQWRRQYRPPYRNDYHNWQGGGYVRPCTRVAVPVYDGYGYVVGNRIVCR